MNDKHAKELIRCQKCGRVIGESSGDSVTIKHKGRIVRCFRPCEIVCENPTCKENNVVSKRIKPSGSS